MKGVSLLLFLSVLIIFCYSSLVTSQESGSEVLIEIEGCTKVFRDGTQRYVRIGECLIQDNSAYYCKSHDLLLHTGEVANSCSFGVGPGPDDVYYPHFPCCPSGTHSCVADVGGYFCRAATIDCSELDEEACILDSGRCEWDDDNGCSHRIGSCYGYKNQPDCDSDGSNVAQNDPNCRYGEVQSYGFTYAVEQSSCRCVWVDEENKCGLTYNITSSFGILSDVANCTFVLREGEECIDGFKDYEYVPTFSDNSLNLLQGDARCIARSGRKICGEPVVRVYSFGFLNFLVVSLMLFFLYLYQNKFNKKKR